MLNNPAVQSDINMSGHKLTSVAATVLADWGITDAAHTSDLTNYVLATRTVNGHALTANVTVSKSDVGLGNADNTSDANKPVSTATQTALDLKVTANGTIVSATKTKITYDAKGLVTSGADATTADIAESTDRRYVTDAQRTVIQNTSGTNTGDQDLSGLVPKVTTVNGHPLSTNVTVSKSDVGLGNADNTSDASKPVSTAQQTAIDLKVTANGAITGATKTKITYDAKGLVTSAADATTADIADSADKRYVTDAQRTVIQNTSGTNTGDQVISDATIATTDITTNNVSTTKHGFTPKLPNDATKFLNGTGGYTVPPDTNSGGTVTSFSAGDLSPLFTTTESTVTSTPALAFSLSTAAAHAFFGNETGSTAAPHFVQPAFTDLSGSAAIGQIPTGTSGSTVALGNHTHTGVYQPADADLDTWAAITPASGIGTFLATPTLVNLKAAVTDETTVGWNLLTLANPGAVTFLQLNADNTVTAQNASAQRTALGLGTLATQSGTFSGTSSGTNTGDQTSVSGNAGTATALATGRTFAITGDLAWTSPSFDGTGNVTAAGTLATVNSNTGALGSSTAIPTVTTNGKGLVTAVTTNAVIAPAGTLSGATLASGVTASSLTSFGSSPTLNTAVLTGLPTGTGVASAGTASTLAARDANANITANNWLGGYTTTATAAGTTTLTVGSTYVQFFTGSTTQTVTLPVASTLTLGHQFVIVNNSTGAVTVNSSGANAVIVLAGGTSATVTCILTSGTTAASWNSSYFGDAVASGKKLTVSNTLTLAGTDGVTYTGPSTSATLARTDAANTFTGHQTIEGVTSTGATGTGKFVFDASPSIGSPTFTGTIAGTPAWASSQALTLSTAAQPNITSIGTLTKLSINPVDDGTDSAISLRQSNSTTNGFDWSLDQAVDGAMTLSRVTSNAATTILTIGRVTPGFTFGEKVIFGAAARLKVYTVATLPAATQGDTAAVSDALTPTFLAIVVGGGSTYVPVTYNGTNWVGY